MCFELSFRPASSLASHEPTLNNTSATLGASCQDSPLGPLSIFASGGSGPAIRDGSLELTLSGISAPVGRLPEPCGGDMVTHAPDTVPMLGKVEASPSVSIGATRSSARFDSARKVSMLERAKLRKVFLLEGKTSGATSLPRQWDSKKVLMKGAQCGVKLSGVEAEELHKFLLLANGRKRCNAIHHIVDDNGEQIHNEAIKNSYFFHTFKRLFGSDEAEPASFGDWANLYRADFIIDPDSLTGPFTIDEIKKATFQLGSEKAPGPDGFPLIFFQYFWETVKDIISNIFTDLQENNLFTAPTDYPYVCLIPKKEGACHANDFRPICLMNGIQKIISKVLANRIATILPMIISSSQAAFLKDRLLADSFVTASELLNWCAKSGKECVSIKVDFEKAYDNVRWSFLQSILRWLGFSEKWITEAARGNNLIQGIGPTVECQTTILQYADDTLFFSEPKKSAMSNLLFLWKLFEWASGLKINTNKTELYYLGTNENRAKRLADILGCGVGKLPFRYLGLPLHISPLRKKDWAPIINRIEMRIEGWKAKLLSHGGRVILVNSVLSNLPLFYFAIFKASQWVLNRIEALRRAFFWKGCSNISGGSCLVSWKIICKSKREGGLGIKDMEAMNKALLTKWWWRFFNERHLLWRRLVTALYYTRRRLLNEGRSFRPYSQWWRSVMSCREVFKCGVSYVLGDGKNIRWWSDIWIEETPLSTRFSDRQLITSLKNLLNPYSPSGLHDILKWRWTANQNFTVKSLYDFVTDAGQIDPLYDHLWGLKILLKQKIFIWILLRKRLLTADRLIRGGISVDQHCMLCGSILESCDHLFGECIFVRYLRLETGVIVTADLDAGDVRRLWAQISDSINNRARSNGLTQLATIW
ncbi:uncharacterized protein LOC109707794 [Ananas comosus]|uniref:Uncharacterized protein LOC109707794 n=1 Tax=Ananas comosus TaxID=4615 RepID=A0A6P5EUT6_ANACO|nr:uncharacterized protein LOC109707794 [Ananas comosus]